MEKVTVVNQLKTELHLFPGEGNEIKLEPGASQHDIALPIVSVRVHGNRYANQQGQFTPNEVYDAKLAGDEVVFLGKRGGEVTYK